MSRTGYQPGFEARLHEWENEAKNSALAAYWWTIEAHRRIDLT